LKNYLLARSVPSCSYISTIVTRPHLQVGHSYHDGMIRQFNLQSSECCLPPWKLELTDGALEDILCVRREEMTQNMCGITSNHGGIYRMGMKFEFFKKN
jgi:hypothetical protein